MSRVYGHLLQARQIGLLWGIVDQGLSSGTNFALSLVAARLLGPKGLGIVFIGFLAYLLMAAIQRSLVIDPLIVSSSVQRAEHRVAVTRWGLSLVLVGQVAGSALLALLGWGIGGTVGTSLLLFAPWILPLLLQDFWRAMLFRDGRGGAAAANDGAWAAGMILAAPLLLAYQDPWAVVTWWAAGATLGAGLGFAQTRIAPTDIRESFRWWRAAAWPFGRWLSLETVAGSAGAQGVVLILASVVGVAWLGGLRSVQSIFAPMTLLNPAINLPGLPAMARALHDSAEHARALALRLSIAAAGVVLLYLVTVGSFGRWLLRLVFGREFGDFSALVVPVGLSQLIVAGAMGFSLLLKAAGAGRELLWARLANVSVALVVVYAVAALTGEAGAAWALIAGPVAGSTAVVTLVYKRNRRLTARAAQLPVVIAPDEAAV